MVALALGGKVGELLNGPRKTELNVYKYLPFPFETFKETLNSSDKVMLKAVGHVSQEFGKPVKLSQ